MPTREDVLREKTHKGQTDTLVQRVCYTLHVEGETERSTSRNTKAIAMLMNHLREQQMLTDDAIDDILMGAVDHR